MNNLVFISLIIQSFLFDFKFMVDLMKNNEMEIVEMVEEKGYYLQNRSNRSGETSLIQFTHDNDNYPSLKIYYKDPNFKNQDYVEMRLFPEDKTYYDKLKSIVKENSKKTETFYNSVKETYVTEYINEQHDLEFKVYNIDNIYGEKVLVIKYNNAR